MSTSDPLAPVPDPDPDPAHPVLLGFDPGRDKCGVAVMDGDRTIVRHEVVASSEAIAAIHAILLTFQVQHIVLGDQTTSSTWKKRLEQELPTPVPIHLVDERYTTLEARDRYWQIYPPSGMQRLIPQSLRTIPRPIDDIVAIILIERHLAATDSG